MKVYELKLQKGGLGVFKVSPVKGPAIEDTLLFFKKEDKDILYFADEDKRIFYAPAMIPKKMIFRKNVNGEPADVFYTAETVAEFQINYFRNNGNKNTNINHANENIEGVFPFESWIVQNFETDKAKELGFNVPNGTWMMGYKVDSDEVWKDVKEGKIDGLSIEAINLDHILKHDTEMKKDKKGLISFMQKGFDKLFSDAEKFEEEIAEVSKWWNTVTNDTFELGETVMRKGFEDGDEPFAINSGEFELEDGSRILTDSEGIIRFIFPAAGTDDSKDDDTNMAADDDSKDDDSKDDDSKDDDSKDDDSKDDDEPTEKEKELMDEIISLKQTIAELKADKIKDDEELETMKKEVVEMKKQTPAAPPIPKGPTATKHKEEKPYEKMSNLEKLKFNREK